MRPEVRVDFLVRPTSTQATAHLVNRSSSPISVFCSPSHFLTFGRTQAKEQMTHATSLEAAAADKVQRDVTITAERDDKQYQDVSGEHA